jgi:hypothetical protein
LFWTKREVGLEREDPGDVNGEGNRGNGGSIDGNLDLFTPVLETRLSSLRRGRGLEMAGSCGVTMGCLESLMGRRKG